RTVIGSAHTCAMHCGIFLASNLKRRVAHLAKSLLQVVLQRSIDAVSSCAVCRRPQGEAVMSDSSEMFPCDPNRKHGRLEQIAEREGRYKSYKKGEFAPHIEFITQDSLSLAVVHLEFVVGSFLIDQFMFELHRALRHHMNLILDLTQIQYLSGAALPELLGLHNLVQRKGGVLVLCNLRPGVKDLFRLSNLQNTFLIEKSIEDALSRMASEISKHA
ncbi:MAG: STAS domain-containing protein, partial [Candidatus Hydrogenedentes bacterium]|nr:STAS domain-containing protein [Candidatus Hydrogenedentota bacterium]